jgi:hypothetical protein
MDDRIRMKQEAGKSVRDFNTQHPSEIEGHAATAAELAQAVDQMDELSTQFETGVREASAATQEKVRVLGVLADSFLRPIAAIARGNGAFDPALVRRFIAPNKSSDQATYLGAARSILTLATEQKAIFVGDGMPESFVEDFGKTLEQYDAVVRRVNTNQQLHVQARAQLASVARQILRLLKRLDGINRARFRNDPHLYQAWLAARNVAWPVGSAAKAAAKAKGKTESA